MSERFPGRIHGDGRVIKNDLFYRPIKDAERPLYLNVLAKIMEKSNISLSFESEDPALSKTLLALKQRLTIGFSNGCPWPEKAISEFLQKQEELPKTLDELTSKINESAVSDGKHSFMFQVLVRHASRPLKRELKSYKPWAHLDGQEDRNLPQAITDPQGKGAYGLANDSPFFDVLIPLYKWIDAEKDAAHQARYFAVLEFIEKVAQKTQNTKELAQQTQEFLAHPEGYLKLFIKNIVNPSQA